MPHSDDEVPNTEEEIGEALKHVAEGYRNQLRSPVLSSPADAGLDFDDVSFPAKDGVALEG